MRQNDPGGVEAQFHVDNRRSSQEAGAGIRSVRSGLKKQATADKVKKHSQILTNLPVMFNSQLQ
jgi:hypothetical protein